MAFVVIQEGGSSAELYVSVWDTEDEAETHRVNCAADGAYRTTPVFGMPDNTDWSALEDLLGGLSDLECLDVPEDHEATSD